jgi:type I restriction enzyme S subunit
MRSNYSKLEDVADVIDSLHKTPRYSETGYSMVRCTDVKYGRLSLKDTFKVDEDVFKEFSRRYKPQQSDIVITRVGSYGNTAFVEDANFCLGQNTAAIVPKINPRFLYLALNSAHIKRQIEFSVVGSTQKTLSLKAINNLEIPRFEPFVEGRISEIVGSLDDKIDLNCRINQTLEAMAQAIFKSWFVDFDPVKAKIAAKQEGRDPLRAAMSAISGKTDAELDALPREQYDSLATAAALFPDEMDKSELGEIPKGWAFQSAETLAEVGIGKTPPSSLSCLKFAAGQYHY